MSRFLLWLLAILVGLAVILFALGYTLLGLALSVAIVYAAVRYWRHRRMQGP